MSIQSYNTNNQYDMMPAASRFNNAGKTVAQINAANMLERIGKTFVFTTETAENCHKELVSKNPGALNTLALWTLPPLAGAASAAATGCAAFKLLPHIAVPVTSFVLQQLWNVTSYVGMGAVNQVIEDPTSTTSLVALGTTAATTMVAMYRGPGAIFNDPRKQATKAFFGSLQLIGTASLMAMWAMSGWAASNTKEKFAKAGSEYDKLKVREQAKMKESLQNHYMALGAELSARFIEARQDPVKLEELKDLVHNLNNEIEKAKKRFTEYGLNPSDISLILEPMKTPMSLIKSFQLELRTPHSVEDHEYNARLLQALSKKADIGLTANVIKNCTIAKNNEMSSMQVATGYTQAVAKGAFTSLLGLVAASGLAGVTATFVLDLDLANKPQIDTSNKVIVGTLGAAVGTITLMTLKGYQIGKAGVNEVTAQKEKSDKAVDTHAGMAYGELKDVYDGIAKYWFLKQKNAETPQEKRDLELAMTNTQEKLPGIAAKIIEAGFSEEDAEKILKPLKEQIAAILSPAS